MLLRLYFCLVLGIQNIGSVQGKKTHSVTLGCVTVMVEGVVTSSQSVLCFVNLYETTGQGIAKVAADVLLRLNLPMSGLRGQTYDGASNMAGKHTGAQAILRRQQPLALYVHCGAPCVNYTSWLLGLLTDPGLSFLGPPVGHPFWPVREVQEHV